MAPPRQLGEPLQLVELSEDVIMDGSSGVPGLQWQISEETQEQIEEIEANSRVAEHQCGEIALR